VKIANCGLTMEIAAHKTTALACQNLMLAVRANGLSRHLLTKKQSALYYTSSFQFPETFLSEGNIY